MRSLRSTSALTGRPQIDEALECDGDFDAAGFWQSP